MEKGEVEGRGVEVGCSLFIENFFFVCYQRDSAVQAAKYTCAGGYIFAFCGLMGCGILLGFFACICEAFTTHIPLIDHSESAKVFL